MSQLSSLSISSIKRILLSASAGTSLLGLLISGCGPTHSSSTKSITEPEWQGKKYYLGWGAANLGDPSNMHNEVKYDVLHTSNVFTKKVGGDYTGSSLIGPSEATSSKIRTKWSELKNTVKPTDMYVQYSSGHGSQSGLGVGVSYNEIRDSVLALNAKESVVFTMACFSGNLVDSFNKVKDRWKDYAASGKTLLIVSSSMSSETSSTGPGTDPDEAGGPNGSAGSAFGNALWKGIIGYADGTIDGVKDKKITLSELLKYVVAKTQEFGEHTPTFTGVYDPNLVMTLVPTRGQLEMLLGESTEGQRELEQILSDGVID